MTGGVCLSEVLGFGVTARVKSRVMLRRQERPQIRNYTESKAPDSIRTMRGIKL